MGKIKPITVLQKYQKHKATFMRLGNNWEVPNGLINELEDFTCKLFGKTHITKIDDHRLYMMKEKCGTEETISPHNIDLATLPRAVHIRRVNYQVCVWKRAHELFPEVPSPLEGHGWTMVNGCMEPLWTDGDILPTRMLDILDTCESDSEDDSDVELDICTCSSDSDD